MGLTPQPPMDATQLSAGEAVSQSVAPSDPKQPPKELQIAIWRLLMDMEEQDEIPRRYEIKDILKRRLFFRNEQYWWYDNDTFQWMPPNVAPQGQQINDFEQPAFRHCTNIFQSTLLSLCAVLSQNNTTSKFFPKKASDPNAIQTAKNASKAIDFIHQNNDFQNLVDMMTYFMGTDGFLGGYTRYVSDGERFGHDEQDIYAPAEVPVGNPQVQCVNCGEGGEGTTDMQPTCARCGNPMADIPAPTATIPQYAGTVKIPRGQEVISIVPALQLKRTMWADEQKDFLYMDWITDLHKAKAIATYPDKEQELNTNGGESDGGTANSYERIARRLLYLGTGRHTGMVLKDLGTFRRAWIRKDAFFSIPGHDDNEATPCTRCQLLQLYPDGVKAVFFNETFCEADNECMDEKWETMHTMPGEGQLRETLMSAVVPIQEQLNDCINLLFEICMYGVPEGFADTDLLDMEARSQQTATSGNITPTMNALGNNDIRAKLMFTPATEPSQGMMRYIEMLMTEILQTISGNYPALAGGNTGANDTATGISIQRNQAMGRIGRAWRRMQIFLANLDCKSIRVFAKNRTDDVEIPKQTNSGEFDSDVIRLQDMQGEVTAYPEVDAQYPTLQADIRALVTGMYQNVATNPISMQLFSDPDNIEYALRQQGIDDIEVPGEQQRIKTYKTIDQLLTQQPQQLPAQSPSPQMPQGAPPQMLPSIQPDPDVDDLKVVATTSKKWLISDTGIEAMQENPAGYANVKAFLKACTQLEKQQELQQQMAAMALQGEGPAADLGAAEQMNPPEGAPHPANLAVKQKAAEAKAKAPNMGAGGPE